MNGLEHPGVLDAFAHDTRADKLVLAMYENRPWLGEEAQLLQLQEKLNAYLSFVLDGEMKEAFPQFAEKPVEIQLRTVHEPDEKASALMARIHEQLALQDIHFEVIQVAVDEQPADGGGGCGSGCGCATGPSSAR